MSQFNKKGFRKDKIRQQVEHLNSFYKILDNLEDLHQELIQEGKPQVTIDNIQELVSEITGRPLDNIELMVLKGKLGLDTKRIKDEQKDNKE
jgi:hypothetical protein